MFTLKAKREPEWMTLIEADGDAPAVRVLFAPPSRPLKRKARREAAKMLGEIGSLEEVALDALDEAGEAFSRALIAGAILTWEGIGDAQGKAVEPSPDAIEMFLESDLLFERADALYVLPVVERDREKNASNVSPNGTGEAETVAKGTARSPAKRKPRADAKSALTEKTSRPRRRAKPSGS